MQALFDAVDVSAISGNVTTLLIAFIGIRAIFLGYRYVIRVFYSG